MIKINLNDIEWIIDSLNKSAVCRHYTVIQLNNEEYKISCALKFNGGHIEDYIIFNNDENKVYCSNGDCLMQTIDSLYDLKCILSEESIRLEEEYLRPKED